jgi:rod shape-determining protein MreC
VQLTLHKSFYEFQAPLWIGSSKIEDLHSYWSTRTNSENKLIEAGIQLSRNNHELRIQLDQVKLQQEELNSLRSLHNLSPINNYTYETARVCKRDLTSWWQEITIRKGDNHGILKNSPVIFAGGVVGKVKETYETTSTVLLITSRHFRMAARFENDPRPVTYIGSINSSFGNPKGIVRDAPSDVIVTQEKSQKLVSSGLGSIFPEGINIGTVHYLEPGTNGLFKAGKVLLDKRLLYLKEVSVLLPKKIND